MNRKITPYSCKIMLEYDALGNNVSCSRPYCLRMGLKAYFTEHPASVGESYGEHFRVASHFSKELLLAGIACAVHAIVPNLFTTTGSSKVRQLHSEMTQGMRGQVQQDTETEVAAEPQPVS